MSRDPLAAFWCHQIQIARLVSNGSYGPTFQDPPETASVFVDTADRATAGTRLVTNPQGQQVVSTITVYGPPTIADVPPGSRVTLPAAFGSREATVITFARRELPGQDGAPEHVQLDLQ